MATLTFNLIPNTRLYTSDCGDGQSTTGPQLYYYSTSTSLPSSLNLANSWQSGGYYIFTLTPLVLPAQFASLIVQGQSGFPQGTRFLWTADPNTAELQLLTLAAPTADTTFSFRDNVLSIPTGCQVTLDADNNQFLIAQPGGESKIEFQTDGGSTTLPNAVGQTVYLPLCGSNAGCFQFQLGLISQFLNSDYLDVALRYFLDDPVHSGKLLSIRSPFLNIFSAVVMMNLDPLNAANPARNYMSFSQVAGGGSQTPQQLASYFCTNTGQPITLTPLANAQLVVAPNSTSQTPSQKDPLYWVPSGDFAMSAASSNPTQPNDAHGPRLMCGLGGNEYFDIGSAAGANLIGFVPGQNAYIPNFSATQSGTGQLESNATTSWVTIKPASGGTANYYAQPQSGELFATGFPSASTTTANGSNGNQPQVLGFLEVSAINFSDQSVPAPFPLIPYSGAEPGGFSLDTLSAIEAKVLSPLRRATLGYQGPQASASRMANPTADPSPPSPNSTTPQGLLANVSGATMNTLVLGQSDSGEQLLLDVANSDGLQAALQTNQQFIVVTDLNAIKFLQSQISIAGWTFDLAPQSAGDQPEGDYYNVLILKYYSATIEELAANTQLWTNGSVFNSNLESASAWLQSYIQDAQQQLTAGNTLFQGFVDLVSDSSWNGILALNLYIPPNALPSEVQGLLGGIDISKFSAHHFGVETNSIAPDFSLTKSSLFGLIDYNNSAGTASAQGNYAFQVLTLQIGFANSEITDFNSQIAVVINNLFDVPASLSSGSNNAVILQGSYESHNGVSSYSFSASGSYIFNLNSALIKTVELDKVQFSTDSADSSGNVTSTFSIWGSIGFGSLADFDFFSFDDLAFAGLSLSFTFNPAKIGTDGLPLQSFTFDPGNIRFDVSISQARQNSLLGNFPLRLTGFTYASEGLSISGLGYLPLESPITPADNVVYALMFELNLGSVGALASPLKGFAAEFIAGWDPNNDGAAGLGIKMPVSSGGKLQIGIEGVLLLTIQNFAFASLPASGSIPARYVLLMKGCTLDVFGTTVPPSGNFTFLFFAPSGGSIDSSLSNLGWFVAYSGGDSEAKAVPGGTAADAEGGSSILELSYLGLGQRVQVPGGLDDANTVSEVLEAISSKLTPDLQGDELNQQLSQIYNPDQGWIVGGKFTIFDTLTLGAVFYDPDLYGLLIGIAQGKLGGLGGFNFEILYKKVTDTIGVYEIQLTLPDSLRQLQFGEVSITIPVIGIDVYTNGNFKVDVGFPVGTDFSNSLTVQVFPFIGAGGFYYAQLSQGTATNVPTPPQGSFNPVLEFGFGLSLGVGKTINQGILSAGLSVTFVGILEGTVAYWVPPNQLTSGAAVMFDKAPDYYEISGQIAIVGTLYGVVDFGIVKASLTVTISAGATLVWKAYDDLVLGVYAKVSVSLTVVIGGFKIFGHRIEIKISFSFSAEISYTWTIPDNRTPPWASSLPLAQTRMMLGAVAGSGPISWNSLKVFSTPSPVHLYFSPQVTVAPSGTALPDPQFVALLTMSTIAASGASDFDNLGSAFLGWVVALYNGQSSYDPTAAVTAADVSSLSTLLSTPGTTENDGPSPLNYENISSFLADNFTATIGDVPATTDPTASQNSTIFPMIPDLVLSATGLQSPINFSQAAMVPASYLSDITEYFSMLLVNYGQSQSQSASIASQMSMATVIFQDYFALTIKASISEALQYLNSQPAGTSVQLSTLLSTLQQQGAFSSVAAQASRFLLHGLSLPQSFPADSAQWPSLPTQPLYQLLQQQIPLAAAGTSSSVGGSTAPTNTTFSGGATLSQVDGFYIGYTVTFTSGALSGQSQTVSGYTAATQSITVSAAFTQAPAAGDSFVLSASASSSVTGTPTADSFTASALASIDNSYPGCMVAFTSGALNGQFRLISAYTGATGQITVTPAFVAAPAVGDNFVITPFAAGLSIDTSPTNAWYTLDPTAAPTSIMSPDSLATIQSLIATTFSPSITVQQLPNLSQQPQSYALQRPIPWQLIDDSVSPAVVNDSWTICPFPTSLMSRLGNSALPLPELTLMTGTPGSSDPPSTPQGLTYNWATLVNLTLQQIPIDSSTSLPNTFQVGGSDETGRNLIFNLLNQLNSADAPQIDNIYLLFQPQQQSSSGMVSETNIVRSSTVLMKVNLSTESAPAEAQTGPELLKATAEPPADDYNAMMDQYAAFLRLIWECSIVNAGGYYFYYLNTNQGSNSLPAYLFSGGSTTQVSLLVTFTEGSSVGAFNNAVVVTDQGENSNQNQVLFAQASNVLSWEQNIAAGSIAFELTTADPSSGVDDQSQLLTLFNLLTCQIESNATFNTSMQSLPAGPVDPPEGQQSGVWNYQQGISVYPWYKTGDSSTNASPYAGIGNQVQLSFALRDLFGNEMPVQSPLPTLNASYLYFDDLIPVTSWSGVSASYLCSAVAGEGQLQVTLSYDGSTLAPVASSVDDASPSSGSFAGSSGLASADNFYVGLAIKFTSGALAGQQSTVSSYSAASREIAVSPSFSAAPASGDSFVIFDEVRSSQLAETYQLINYQLAGPGVTIELTTSLAPSLVTNVAADQFIGQSGFVSSIIAWLNAVASGTPNPTAPAPLIITVPIPLSQRETNTSNIFEVTVTLTIEREASLVDPNVNTIPAGGTVSLALAAPSLITPNAGGTTPSLLPFAQAFESAFTEMRLATGLGSSGPSSIWAIRIGAIQAGNNGITVAIDSANPVFFAPKPLSNTLVSRPDANNPNPVMVMPYQSGGPDQPMVPFNFPGVDLDVFASGMLNAIDQFLSPAFAVPARQLSPEYYLAVITAKEALASEIALGVTNVLVTNDGSPSAEALAAAQEAFEQRLLVSLSSDYSVSTIVQYPASVTISGTEETVPPNLYGQVMNGTAQSISSPSYTLSTSKIPLSTSGSLLTFLFDSGVNQQAAVPVDLEYQVTHIEHDISESEGPDGYTSSSWLTLITSQSAAWPTGNTMPAGQTSIPVPLRAYPVTPILVDQSALAGPSVEGASQPTLASQRLWHYECQYQQSYVPQDSIAIDVQFNTPPPPSGLLKGVPEGQLDLFDWLARFSYEYSLMQADLSTIPTAQPGDQKAIYAIQRFAELVWGAAFGTQLQVPIPSPPDPSTGPWALWVTGQQGPTPLQSKLGGVSMAQYQYGYQVEELNPLTSGSGIKVIPDDASYPYPDIIVQNAQAVVSGTNPAPGAFQGNSTLPAVDGSFVGAALLFTSGALAGQSSMISAFTGSSRTITVEPEFSQAPALGDQFVIQTLLQPSTGQGSATYNYENPEPSSGLVRTMVFNNLDVMSTENAWGGIQLSRNKVLVALPATTNPEFIYQTPMVRFVNQVTPGLDSSTPVNIAQIQSTNASTTLEYFLCVLFDALFAATGSGSQAPATGSRTIRLACSYSYDIRSAVDNNVGPLMVSLPVLLFLPFEFDLSQIGAACTATPPSSSFASQLGEALRAWFTGYNPSTASAVFTFDVSVFAGLTQTNLPVLRLRNLLLNYKDIQPIS